MRQSVLVVFLILVISVSQAFGAIYSYRDAQGRLYLTDNPPCDKYKIVVTTRKDCKGPSSPSLSAMKFSSFRADQFLLHDDEAYSKYINQAAKKHGVDPYLIKAVIKAESDFDSKALSSKGAGGLMQLMPATARIVGCHNLFNPKQNILGGTSYLRSLLDRYKGQVNLALAAYNAGPGNVDKYKGIPPFRETRNYVKKVRHYYKKYGRGLKSYSKANAAVRVMPVVHSDLSRRLKSAYSLFEAGNVEGAKEAYRHILNIYPRNTQALYNLACLLDMDCYFEEAIDTYKEALKQDRYLDKANYNLAVIYEKMGMNTEAINAWKNYIQVTQDEDKIRMAERYIKELQEYASLK